MFVLCDLETQKIQNEFQRNFYKCIVYDLSNAVAISYFAISSSSDRQKPKLENFRPCATTFNCSNKYARDI